MKTGLRSVLTPSVILAKHYGFGAFFFSFHVNSLSAFFLMDIKGYQNGDVWKQLLPVVVLSWKMFIVYTEVDE